MYSFTSPIIGGGDTENGGAGGRRLPGLTAAQRAFGGTDDVTLTRENAAKYLRDMVEEFVKARILNQRCGICGSDQFTYEDRPTRYTDIDEATIELQRLEAEQMTSRALLDAQGRTFDSQISGGRN